MLAMFPLSLLPQHNAQSSQDKTCACPQALVTCHLMQNTKRSYHAAQQLLQAHDLSASSKSMPCCVDENLLHTSRERHSFTFPNPDCAPVILIVLLSG